MSATQSIIFQHYAGGGDDSFGTTLYSAPKPSCEVGDLLVMQIATSERIRGVSALVMNNHDLVDWTDVLTDGYSEIDTKQQYVLDGGSGTRQFWWVGTKIATSDDARPGVWTYEIKSSLASPFQGADRTENLAVAYRGASGVGTWVAVADASPPSSPPDNAILVCPDDGYGERYFDNGAGGFGNRAAISMTLLPITGSLPLLLCGGTGWHDSSTFGARAPLVMRGQFHLPSIVTDTLVWGENAPLTVHVKHPNYIGHDHF